MALALAALVLFGLLALPSLRFLSDRQSPPPVATAAAVSGPSRGLDSAPALVPAPRASARPVTAEENERTRALTVAINAAMKALGNKPAAMGPARPIPHFAPNALAHRGAAATPEQTRALARLRWNSPGKTLDWRTAATKPIISYLAGARLEPAAPAADPGLSLAATTARNFLRQNADLLGAGAPDQAWQPSGETTDTLGYTQLRYGQRWQGLEVWPASIAVQTAPNGHVTLLTGAYAPEPAALDREPDIPAAAARRCALRTAGLVAPRAAGEPELLVHAPLESDARLAWRVQVHKSPVERWHVFIDARDGSVIERVSLVATAAATGTGTDLNGVSRQINLWRHTDNKFYTIDTSKPMYDPTSQPPNISQSRGIIAVLDLQGGVEPNVANAVHNVANASNGPWDADAVSASANLSKVYDYYRARFNRNSVDGRGGSMTGVVNMNQANAFSDFQTLTLTFGNTDKYAEALDVVGHEMTHSVISTTSNLVYRFQSGALNESFSDILGEGCEAHFNGGTPDWLMGTALRTQDRSFIDPNSREIGPGQPYPKRMSQFYNLNANQDAGGVHINSSITNHCFYQLAVGLNGGIGLDDALQIFYRAVTTKLNQNSQFIDARLGCIQSANELFGNGSTQAQRTALAFDAVEIFDQQGTPAPTPLPTVNATDSTLFVFPSGAQTFLGRREAAFGDDVSGVFLGDGGQGTPVLPGKKPAVRGDGAFAVYVAPNGDGAFINTETGVESLFGLAGQFDSAAISANGLVQAYVLRDGQGNPDNRIYVFDQAANQTVTFTVNQPLTDQSGGATAATVLLVDALDISADGRFVFYDTLNRLVFPGGGFIDNWSVSFIDRQAGTQQNLIPPLPGVNVGNPSLGQTRPDLLTFDVSDSSGSYFIYAANLTSGTIQPLAVLAGAAPVAPGWPGYSGDDSAIVFTNYVFNSTTFLFDPFLQSQPVQSNGVSANGAAFTWLAGSFPSIGTIYRRGSFQGPASLSVTASDATASETGANHGAFTVARTGPTTGALAFSFVVTGTAANGSDYARLALTSSIPAGQTQRVIPVTVIDDAAFEGSESAVLTLSENSGYTLGGSRTATVTIADNDVLTFASWAAGHGIGATDYQGDLNGDGRPHLVDYALGANPRGRRPANDIRIVLEAGRGVLEVTRTWKPTDVTVTVEVSDALGNGTWVSGAAHTTALTDSATSLRVRDNSTVAAKGRRSMRLKVQRP